jgi:hypothetical protein
LVSFVEPETITDGSATFPADLPMRVGDYPALALEAGASASLIPDDGSTTLRWRGRGARRLASADPPNGLSGTLFFEAEISPGSTLPEAITGREARGLQPGRTLATRGVEPLDGKPRELRSVVVGTELFIDLFVARRRTARIAVADASAAGSGAVIEAFEGRGPNAFVFNWRNADGESVRHSYITRASTLVALY